MLHAAFLVGESKVSLAAMESPSPRLILVVEDDEDTRDALRVLLVGQNYPVLDASNGQEALGVLARTRPALIIMDLSMPVMSGWQLLDFIQQKRLLPGVPIIVLSADSKPPSADVCFLQKPVGAEHLLEAVSARLCH
jgi:two-component system, OmpR family, response regulator CpxR